MRGNRKNWLAGYVVVKVKGDYPERFFELCARNGIKTWDIIKQDSQTCTGRILKNDVPLLRQLKRRTIYKIYFKNKFGLPFQLQSLSKQKPFMIGVFLAFLSIFFLSNVIWRIDIVGLDNEMEKKVTDKLQTYGVTIGNFQWNVASPLEIQKQLLEDIPELLWIGVNKQGSAFHLEGVEKTIVEKEEELGPAHIVANKEGVIADIYAENGQPLVKPNDVVAKGDRLISGIMGNEENEQTDDEENDKKEEKKRTLTSAKGEVIAKVWYRSEIEIPLEENYSTLTGEYKKRNYVKVFKWKIPIFSLSTPFEDVHQDIEEKDIYFLKWKLPITWIKEMNYERESKLEKRTVEEAREFAKKQAQIQLLRNLPKDAEILEEKVLHEREENGKVKITLYYTVLENIAKRQPINQGD
ncbi:hypothetical protein GGQ92_000591 [Gracilibacillus halotolerans]|uniref:Stage IV sporulation protein n=1 Tax=Gracilibacillus halotolerans TaxID=74386 RepID=A0A841RLJ1_9BACI|nr:sporulation protein YqfD [Gracilibacillus halotolerans]MBB6511824.1 hypothetical protein [Gracilibacillus halotolerans]